MSRANKHLYKNGKSVHTVSSKQAKLLQEDGYVLYSSLETTWVSNYDILEQKKIVVEELETYEINGWSRGMLPTRIRMTNGVVTTTVSRVDYRSALDDGFRVFFNKYRRSSRKYKMISDAFSKNTYVKRYNKKSHGIDRFPV